MITMTVLKLSTAEHFPEARNFFQDRMAGFEATTGFSVDVEAVPWDRLWLYLQEVMNGEADQDISEVGSTWVAHFIYKNAISRLKEQDILELGGMDGFLAASWESSRLMGQKEIFAVPWLADTRVVYFWRDHLRSVGVEEKSAFETPERMERTIAKLAEKGFSGWGAPTFEVNNTLHQIASWIWAGGGDFLDEKGIETAFLDPAAFEGIKSYFNLYRYMSRRFDSLEAVLDCFEDRQVSVIINGPWFLMRMILGGATEETLAHLGVALPPGPPFVGGSNLVLWRRGEMGAAVELARHLVSSGVQREICKATGLMPVRSDVLKEAPYDTDPHYQAFTRALKCGRPVPSIAFWGALEDSLHKGFGAIWRELKDMRDCDLLDSIIMDCLSPIARRFDRLLKLVNP